MKREHKYTIEVTWTGNLGMGTDSYTAYTRDHAIKKNGAHPIEGSSDPAFRGNPNRYNPEELLLSTLSSCHMLVYLHLCAVNGITVTAYQDQPEGVMLEDENGSGRFVSAVLKPVIGILEEKKLAEAMALHEQAHKTCFIANSVNFKIDIEPEISIAL